MPYFLYDGSLLFLVRECNVGGSDTDLNVDQTLWQKPGNSARFETAMSYTGLKKKLVNINNMYGGVSRAVEAPRAAS